MNELDFIKKAIELSQKSVDIGGYPAGMGNTSTWY